MKKGEASSVMTKLVNDATGYMAAFSALTVQLDQLAGKSDGFVRTTLIISAVIAGAVLFCYWIDHVVSHCEELKDSEPPSKRALIHSTIILFTFLVAYPAIVITTVWAFLQSFK